MIDLTPPPGVAYRDKTTLLDLFFQGHVFTYHPCPEGPTKDYTIRDTVFDDVIQFRSHTFNRLFKIWFKTCLNLHGKGFYCLTCGNRRIVPYNFDRTIATGLGGAEFWTLLKKQSITESG